jgi:hypothetical protein
MFLNNLLKISSFFFEEGKKEMYSLSVGMEDQLLAVGSDPLIYFWLIFPVIDRKQMYCDEKNVN